MLKIDHLTKTYGEKKAVDDLSLHIRPGEIYGFIGHNGAGKTTTLKSCCGIARFDSGEIYVGGRSIRDDPIGCKKQIAYIPDNPDLYEFMTGIQYLSFVADVFEVGAADRKYRIRRCADAFELTEDLAQPISAYSHGMKQKLAIISALVHQPKNLWIAQSLPVSGRQVLRAKLRLSLLLTWIPAIPLVAAVEWLLKRGAPYGILIPASAAAFAALMAEIGLVLNLKMPNFHWTSEIVPLKQSAPVTAALFGGWLMIVVLAGACVLLRNAVSAGTFFLLLCAALFLAALRLYHWLMTKGTKIFEAL